MQWCVKNHIILDRVIMALNDAKEILEKVVNPPQKLSVSDHGTGLNFELWWHAIGWTNVDQVLWYRMTSLGHKELKSGIHFIQILNFFSYRGPLTLPRFLHCSLLTSWWTNDIIRSINIRSPQYQSEENNTTLQPGWKQWNNIRIFTMGCYNIT